MDTASFGADATSPNQHIRLACQACQRKKVRRKLRCAALHSHRHNADVNQRQIKCDRNFPCGQCTRSNLHCVPSTRKPRARHVGKRTVDSELRSRITKLESLVETLSGEVGAHEDDSGSEGDRNPERTSVKPSPTGKYIAGSFWSSLTGEVQALKDALEDDHDDEEDSLSPSTSSGPNAPVEYDLIVCPPGSVYIMPGALPEPNAHLSATLCRIFSNNVDRIFKLFHIPTLQAFMIDGGPYLAHDNNAACNRALKAAIWFSAVNSLSDADCQILFGQSRLIQLQQLRKVVDVALAQADLMVTNDLATVQAFAVYMMASRLTDTSRRMWTLTALLVRTGRAIGLHNETTVYSPFVTELRRRLWHHVRFLDVFTSWDRSSEILITMSSFDTPRPKNVNDSEFDESSTSIPDHEEGFTDMSFSLLAQDATYLTTRFLAPESKPNGGDTWEDRVRLCKDFEQRTHDAVLQYLDTSDPCQRMMEHVCISMMCSQKLRAVRPLRKHPASQPPRVDSPEVLKLALDSLKAGDRMFADDMTAPYRWLIWVPWHALAVALAGLCAIRDTNLANEAWPYVERMFVKQSSHVADNRNGMLWRPMEKLYKTACAFREHRDLTPSDSSPQQPHKDDLTSTPSTTKNTYPAPTQRFDPTLGQSLINSQTIPGAMPTSGVLNQAMNLDFDNSMVGDFDVTNNNMNWMDFQNILEDMSTPAPDITFGGAAWPGPLPLGNEGWSNGTMPPSNFL